MQTTIEQFLAMNEDYKRLTLEAVFDMIGKLHHELSAIKNLTAEIKYAFLNIDEMSEMSKQRLIGYSEAKASINDSFEDIKSFNKQRLPYINRAFELAESLLRIISDPKKYAEYARRLELNEMV